MYVLWGGGGGDVDGCAFTQSSLQHIRIENTITEQSTVELLHHINKLTGKNLRCSGDNGTWIKMIKTS